jgi:hypothetical protein
MWEDGRIFESRHPQYMQLLVPHLDRAIRLQMRLNFVALRSELMSVALDSLTIGVIVVDQAGRKTWNNRRAEEIASDPETLMFSGTQLLGRNASRTQVVRGLIDRAVGGEAGLLPIERRDSKPLLLLAIPLRPAITRDCSPEAVEIGYAAVFITDWTSDEAKADVSTTSSASTIPSGGTRRSDI